MKILDFTEITGSAYAERQKNVLYKTDDFKIRIIDLPPKGTIPECDMITHVVFVVMSGQVDITVNGKEYSLIEKQSLASEPASFSMRTDKGAKLMGIQIQEHESKVL